MPLARVIAERPDVFNHNVETVPRLYPLARRGSRFLRSCRVLRNAKEMGGDEVVTKSGLMTGLGESKEELIETFGILREHDVQVLTVGQYLRPTRDHLPGGALLASRGVRRARARGLRAGLRVRGRRPARALELPRRADARRRPGLAGMMPRARALLARGARSPRRGAGAPAAALPRDGAARTRPLARAARRRRSSAPRWPPRGSGASSTWSAASSSPGGGHDGGGRALRHPPRPLEATARHAVGAQPPDGGRLPRPPYVHGGYAGAAGLDQPDRARCCATTRRATAGAGCPARATPRAAHAAAVIGAPPLRGRRRERLGLAALAGGLRLRARGAGAAARASRVRARNHTTGVASGGRFYVLAGRDAGNLRRRRALRPAPAQPGSACRRCARRAAGSRRRG